MEEVLKEVRRLSSLENKGILERVLKFNEEFGEFAAEIGKLIGYTYKEYDEEHLVEEGADALIVLYSIIFKICDRQGIKFERFIEKMKEKNVKWDNKIPLYRTNL